MRRAEAHWWLAEVSMDLDRFDEAAKHLVLAAPTILKEYGAGHSEYRRFRVHQALLAGWLGDVRAAQSIRPIFQSDNTTQKGLIFDVHRLDLVIAVQGAECTKASNIRQNLVADNPRQRLLLVQLDRLMNRGCP
ncbi:MAG: hypothetical protein IPK97_15170 [Ahniella sp.]|nr:hypothetical protein [Ahniella sp.]